MNILLYCAAFITGILASMGLGGGMVLILYLTLISGMPQIEAQGINLLFFIPIAISALVMHTRSGLVKWKKIIPAIICGALTAVAGSFIAGAMDSSLLTKAFAIFVFITGIRELFSKIEDEK
ncbi:MAG: TSUP family transporter [Porcipelethomonas sp.]